jgi:flavin-dependent dehydrogenase
MGNSEKGNELFAEEADVAIVGGGLAGLSLALQLRDALPDISICVIEKNSFPVAEAAHKVGESTVELATHYFANVLGLREHLVEQQLPKLGLRFFFGKDDNSKIEERLELGAREFPPAPSFQLDRGRFENYLSALCVKRGIEVRDAAKVADLRVSENDERHMVSFTREGNEYSMSCRWLIDAAGRAKLLRKQLGLEKESMHKASSAWFRLGVELDVNKWSDKGEWLDYNSGETSRWYSTNHLMGRGYWVWVIPLASGSTSVGIVAEEGEHPLSEFNTLEKALNWLESHEPQCARKIREVQDSVQDFRALKHYSHDCSRVFSSNRWCLTGEAGVFLDPFYSPGSDFIALSNTFVTELVKKDMAGESLAHSVAFFNDIYLSFYRNTAVIFQGQYEIFGNHDVMPLKIVWDFATYWALVAYMFVNDRMTDFETFLEIRPMVERIGALNEMMAQFFLDWHRSHEVSEKGGRIDLLDVSSLYELNASLVKPRDREAFIAGLSDNLALLESLAGEIKQTLAAGDDTVSTVDDSSTALASLQLSRLFQNVGVTA